MNDLFTVHMLCHNIKVTVIYLLTGSHSLCFLSYVTFTDVNVFLSDLSNPKDAQSQSLCLSSAHVSPT